MKTRLTAEEHAQLATEGIPLETYAAMLQESVMEMITALQRCTVTDPELIDADFAPDGTVSGPDWLELHGFPEKREGAA